MTDAMQNQTPDIDPILTNDLGDVSPDQPLVPANDYNMVVKSLDNATSEKTGNKMIVIKLQSSDPITAVSGETIPAGGVTLTTRIMISPTEKRTVEAIKRDLKRFQLACGITSGPFYPLEQYQDRTVKVNVGFAKKTPDYPEDRNEVKRFVQPQ